ncbi:Uncharacterised protein [Vibrio cholerae]|nr:Uncharacterised protein [Vibrio cholerae]
MAKPHYAVVFRFAGHGLVVLPPRHMVLHGTKNGN